MNAQVFFDVHETAQILHMHPESLRRLSRQGKINYGRVGKNYRYTMDQIKAYVEVNGSSALQAKIASALEKASV